jgi:hypothetical protein
MQSQICYCSRQEVIMSGYELKTKETAADVMAFIDTVEHPVRRDDGLALLDLFAQVTGAPAKMWGPSIIGFGQYHYRYESGHEGDMCRLGFSPRKANLVLYVADSPQSEGLFAGLGKHKRGKSCLYINKLADVDMSVLRDLVTESWAEMARRYPG